MKIMIATDMEGVGGVITSAQTGRATASTAENYDEQQRARHLLTQEVNAAVQGAKDGGAGEVVVWDGHHSGNNLLVDELHPDGEYYIGGGYRMWIPLDDSYDAIALLAFHAMAGTPNAVLEHTQSYDVVRYSVNGVAMGEIGQAALLAGHFNIPVIFISSDDAGCREAKQLIGDHIVAVSVKTGVGREGARLKAPAKCRELIQAGVREAVKLVGRPETKPYTLTPPYHVIEEVVARRTHMQSDQELAEGRTQFITRHEYTSDVVPMLRVR